jgi:acyl-CoA synthetase (AMP-forming)/AMP-acid ligase II
MVPIEFLWRAARRFPEAHAVDGALGRLTYRELAARVASLATAIREIDPAPQSRVVVGAGNTIEHLISILAVLAAGKAWAPLNPRNGTPELQRIVEFVEPGAALIDAEMAGRVTLGAVPAIALDRGADRRSLAGILARGENPPVVPPPPLDATQAIKFTGGTTGAPKGVMQAYRTWNTNIVSQIHAIGLTARDRYLCATPITHAAGTYIVPTLATGGTYVFPEEAKAGALLDAIDRYACTYTFAPPTLVTSLVDEQRARPRSLAALRRLIYGAAPMRVDRIREALGVFGPILASTFGQTEAPQIICFIGPEDLARDDRVASVGPATVLTQVEIQDDRGRRLPAGEQGEIAVRGDLLMTGYFRNPQATAATIVDGWLRTGDVGVMDAAGYVFIKDRSKDVIITGGFNVYPSDVEAVLSRHPAVLECAVLGVPDDKWGEAVHAAVQFRPGAAAAPEDMMALVKRELGSVKTPKAVHIMPALPKSGVGKVLKTAIREAILTGRKP